MKNQPGKQQLQGRRNSNLEFYTQKCYIEHKNVVSHLQVLSSVFGVSRGIHFAARFCTGAHGKNLKLQGKAQASLGPGGTVGKRLNFLCKTLSSDRGRKMLTSPSIYLH